MQEVLEKENHVGLGMVEGETKKEEKKLGEKKRGFGLAPAAAKMTTDRRL